MLRLHHPREARLAALQQLCLVAGAVVRRRVGEDDVADAERAKPAQVRAPGQPVVAVEEAVLRIVVLAKPTSRQRDTGARQVDGVPVAGCVDRLDSVGQGQVAVEVVDRRLPVRLGRGGILGRLDEAERERRQVPGSCERQRDDGHRERPPLTERQREHRNGYGDVPQSVDILAERRRNREGSQAGSEVDDEQPAQRASAFDPPCESRAEDAEDANREQFLPRERIAAAVGEQAPEHSLGRAHRDDDRRGHEEFPALAPMRDADAGEDEAEQEERERACCER